MNFTGDVKFAGTDNVIRVKLIGDCGETEEEPLGEKTKELSGYDRSFRKLTLEGFVKCVCLEACWRYWRIENCRD